MSYIFISLVGRTLRFELHGAESVDQVFTTYDPMILCAWHDCLVTGVYYLRHRGMIALTSPSYDAEFATRCAKRFGFGIVRGSSSRRGAEALTRLTRLIK